jgi:hypothetical protein
MPSELATHALARFPRFWPPLFPACFKIGPDQQKSGLSPTLERARREGATDQEIHDTVLIAAAFCMYNRYVDGLATWAPTEPAAYRESGARLAREGYVNSIPGVAAAAPASS